MPGMDGFEVAERVRQNSDYDEIVLIALTGWGQEEDRQRQKSGGLQPSPGEARQYRRVTGVARGRGLRAPNSLEWVLPLLLILLVSTTPAFARISPFRCSATTKAPLSAELLHPLTHRLRGLAYFLGIECTIAIEVAPCSMPAICGFISLAEMMPSPSWLADMICRVIISGSPKPPRPPKPPPPGPPNPPPGPPRIFCIAFCSSSRLIVPLASVTPP